MSFQSENEINERIFIYSIMGVSLMWAKEPMVEISTELRNKTCQMNVSNSNK